MAVLVRLNDFIPNTLIQSAQVDAEFQQLIDLISGVSTTKEAVIKLNHAATPPLALDQLGAGPIQQWKQTGIEMARVNVDGSFLISGLDITSATPTLTFTDTNAEDFRIQANGDALNIDALTGPVTFITFRGGANDDIQVGRPMVIGSGNLRATRPQFTTSIDDANGNESFVLTATASADREFTVANASSAASGHPKLSASGTGSDIRIDLQPKGAADIRGLFSIGQGFVAQAIGATDAPLCALANSSGAKGGEFGLALAGGHFSSIAVANDFVLRAGGAAAGNMILTAFNGGDIKFASATVATDTLKAIITNAGLMGVNRSGPGAQFDVLSGNTARIALIADMPSSPSVDIAQFKVNGTAVLNFKNNGQIKGIPKCVHTNGTATGNVGAGLDSLHSFSLPAGSLANNGDYVKARYGGTFNADDDDKRIVISFAGQTVHDPGTFDIDGGSWYYEVVYLRLTDTTVQASLFGMWNFVGVTNAGGATPAFNAASNALIFAASPVLTVADLDVNASTMLVQAESAGANNDDIVQRLSVIELVQNT